MTTRNHSITFVVGFAFVCIVSLLFLLNKTHENLQETKHVLDMLNGKYFSLSKQFDSLYEYKDRLEKAIINMKEEKTNIIVGDESLRNELSQLKSSQEKLLQSLQDELDACHRREEVRFINNAENVKSKDLHVQINSGDHRISHNNQSPHVPLQLDPIIAELVSPSASSHIHTQAKLTSSEKKDDTVNSKNTNHGGNSIKKITSLKNLHSSDVHHVVVKEKEKEAVQSPIGHVPNIPAQPSGDPNEDLAGNIFV